jgi:hypothetical protein
MGNTMFEIRQVEMQEASGRFDSNIRSKWNTSVKIFL